MQFMLAKYCFYDVNIVYWYHSPQVLPVKMRLKEKALLSNPTKKEVFYDEWSRYQALSAVFPPDAAGVDPDRQRQDRKSVV